jgi:hypothetical protein
MHTPWAVVVWDRSSHVTSKPKPAATTCPALQSYIRMFPLHTYVPKPLQQAASRARRPPWPAPTSPGLEAHHEHSSRLPTRSRARHMRGSNDAAPLSRTTEAAVLHATARVSFPGPARQPRQGKRNRLLSPPDAVSLLLTPVPPLLPFSIAFPCLPFAAPSTLDPHHQPLPSDAPA